MSTHKYLARVYLQQARAFRLRGNASSMFAVTLLQWAASARRRAMAEPVQQELFA